jgi:hypothetical protein
VEPSADDFAQMRLINVDPKYHCQEPVMVIVGRSLRGKKRSVRAFVFPHGEPAVEFKRFST